MTVKELIAILQTMPPDHLVVADAYEDGYNTIKNVTITTVKKDIVKQLYYGCYEFSTSPDALKVVYLDAKSRNEA